MRRDDTRDSRGDQGIGARRRAALVGAGLQIDIKCRAARPIARLFERQNLGMFLIGVDMEAASHHFAVAHHHRAHHRVRAGLAASFASEFQRFAAGRYLPSAYHARALPPERRTAKR